MKYTVQWSSGEEKNFTDKEFFIREIEKLLKYGFHLNWDFYAFAEGELIEDWIKYIVCGKLK